MTFFLIFRKLKVLKWMIMWSYVGNKENQRWLWHAIDHATGNVLAYVFGKRKDSVFLSLKELLGTGSV
ncbi:insertion element IS1 protein InsB [Gammaproteobacteria bacterium]